MLLAISGKFPAKRGESGGDYKDGRFTTDTEKNPRALEYKSISETLTCNLGRMPVLQVGEQSIGQSAAINFYLATVSGLMGEGAIEAAQIISLQEHLKELVASLRAKIPYGKEPTEEELDAFFLGGSNDKSPAPADMSTRSERRLPWWLSRIESALGDKGYAVGSKLSLADVLLYNTFAEVLKDDEAVEGLPQWKREPFYSKERVDKALADCPKIRASCAAVAAHPNVQKWLGMRGVQAF